MKKLSIVALSPVSEWEELVELEKQGHTITRLEINADLIFGPNCWLMTEKHRKYLHLAIKQAKRLKQKQ